MSGSALVGAGLDLGRVGVWTFEFDRWPMEQVTRAAAEIEAIGFRSIWIPEQPERYGREALSHAAILLAATERLVVVNGIARIGVRTPGAMASAQRALADAYPKRHLLGLGIGRTGDPTMTPTQEMGTYLDAMDAAASVSPPPPGPTPRLLAAYGPAMLRLAKKRAAGAHTYLVPVEHTRRARAVLDDRSFLAAEQAVVFEADPAPARRLARAYLAPYLRTRFNLAKFRQLGFDDSDFAHGGSDRLVDDLVCWGDTDAIATRIAAHVDAGADHVAVQVLGATSRPLLLDRLRQVAGMRAGRAPS